MEDSHRVASSVEAFDWLRLRTPVVSYIGALDRLGSVAPSSAGYVHRQSCLRSGRQLPFLRLSAETLDIDTFIEHGMGKASMVENILNSDLGMDSIDDDDGSNECR